MDRETGVCFRIIENQMFVFFEFIFEIVFRRWIVRFLGIRTRFYFLKLFGQKVNLQDLAGARDDPASQLIQDFCNAAVGMVSLIALFLLIAKIFDRLLA